jgi:hypothetical protein
MNNVEGKDIKKPPFYYALAAFLEATFRKLRHP